MKPCDDQLPVDGGLPERGAKALTLVGLAAALALIASSCGAGNAGAGNAGAGDARGGEIACQRRLVELSARPAPNRTGLAAAFAERSERVARMPLGCTENQRLSARLLARTTRRMASTAAGIRGLDALERQPQGRDLEAFRELQSQIEGFEHRRQALREDLGRMTSDGH